MQTVLQHIDTASTTVGAHYIQTIQTINPRFNPHSAAYKVGHFTGKYILPTIGPGIVRARPPNPTHLTTKAAQMLETLEARLAAQSEAFFPDLRPALPTGPRSLPPHLRSTKPNPSATVHRSSSSKLPEKASKAINLPSWRKVEIDIDHVAAGHLNGGWRTMCEGSRKTLFPEGFSKPQLEKIIRQAYKNGKKIRTAQDGKFVVVGEYNGTKIEMYVNVKTKTIETAYPKKS